MPAPANQSRQPDMMADIDGHTLKREPFEHTHLQGLSNLTPQIHSRTEKISTIGILAKSYGLDTVVRWTPVNVCTILHPFLHPL